MSTGFYKWKMVILAINIDSMARYSLKVNFNSTLRIWHSAATVHCCESCFGDIDILLSKYLWIALKMELASPWERHSKSKNTFFTVAPSTNLVIKDIFEWFSSSVASSNINVESVAFLNLIINYFNKVGHCSWRKICSIFLIVTYFQIFLK